jgi:hypothetical protein
MPTPRETDQAGGATLLPVNMTHWFGAGQTSVPGTPRIRTAPGTSLNAIMFGSIAVILVGLVIARIARRRRKGDVPLCPHCDFDLRGSDVLPTSCPECGHPIDIRLVARRRSAARRGLRRSVRLLGRGCVATGIVGLLLVLVLHPRRFDVAPNWWLLHVDALLVPASSWTQHPHGARQDHEDMWGLRSLWNAQIERRGHAGSISDQELTDLAGRLLDWNAAGRRLSPSEWGIIRVARRSDLISFDRLATLPGMRPSTPGPVMAKPRRTEMDSDPDPTYWTIDEIFVSQKIKPGEVYWQLDAADQEDLTIELSVVSVTVGDETFPVDVQAIRPALMPAALENLRWNWRTSSGDWFNLVHFVLTPPEHVTFPPGRHPFSWDLRLRAIWETAPDGPKVLYSTISTMVSPYDVTIVSLPPRNESAEACDCLRRRFAEFGSVETNPEGAAARLVVDLDSMHRAAIGPAKITMTIPPTSTGTNWPWRVKVPQETKIDPLPGDGDITILDERWGASYVRVLSLTLPNILSVGDRVTIDFDSTAFTESEYRDLFRSIDHGDELLGRLGDRIPSVLACRFQVEVPVVPWGSHSKR